MSDLTDYHTCCQYVQSEFDELGPLGFYTQSLGYMYELTHFHFSGFKDSFFQMLTNTVRRKRLNCIADAGMRRRVRCSSTHQEGFRVDLYDLDSPSSRFAASR